MKGLVGLMKILKEIQIVTKYDQDTAAGNLKIEDDSTEHLNRFSKEQLCQ